MKYMCGSCFMPRKFRVGREIIKFCYNIYVTIFFVKCYNSSGACAGSLLKKIPYAEEKKIRCVGFDL